MPHRRAPIVATLATLIASSGLAASPVAAADEPTYSLPAPEGTSLVVQQGHGRGDGRTTDERYALDFVAAEEPDRFPVVAARGGTVIGARSGVVGGRCDEPLDGSRPSCWREVNYVLIDHGDGTSALYKHLKRGTLPVRIGEVVGVGQPLGTAGSSGWTDHAGLGFQVQATPTWDVRGKGGWFQSSSQPVTFSDPDVTVQRSDGVPRTDDLIISANGEPTFLPFRFRARPVGLPATVPLEPGVERLVSGAYEADSPDGYGLHLEAAPTQPTADVRPIFGGQLEFAGCASGTSASLGRTVALRFDLEGLPYLALHSHLLSIDPALLELDPEAPLPIIGSADVIGRYGAFQAGDAESDAACPGADPEQKDLFVTVLRGGSISADGEVTAGTPVSPEPLVGERGYEGFAWWPGPVVAAEASEDAGRPSARWNSKTPASGAHIKYGRPITLKARVRDLDDIVEVRFRAWYPRWPQLEQSRQLDSFDPDLSWRQLATCRAPSDGRPGLSSLCTWDGDARDAKITYVWDPSVAKAQPSAPWLPRARAAMSRQARACVPVSLAVEVIDRAGHVYSEVTSLPRPEACDVAAAESTDGARVLYLDPLVPPAAPTARGAVSDRGWPPVYAPDPLEGAIVWRDRSNNEDGFRIYARRHWLETDCSVSQGPWRAVATIAPNKERYRPAHKQVRESMPIPEIEGVPGYLSYWEYAVAAYNAAGETAKSRVGGFVGGSEAICDAGGLVPPPELEP
jgi:hypothetical protein